MLHGTILNTERTKNFKIKLLIWFREQAKKRFFYKNFQLGPLKRDYVTLSLVSYQFLHHRTRPSSLYHSRDHAFDLSLMIVYLEICYPDCNHVKH